MCIILICSFVLHVVISFYSTSGLYLQDLTFLEEQPNKLGDKISVNFGKRWKQFKSVDHIRYAKTKSVTSDITRMYMYTQYTTLYNTYYMYYTLSINRLYTEHTLYRPYTLTYTLLLLSITNRPYTLDVDPAIMGVFNAFKDHENNKVCGRGQRGVARLVGFQMSVILLKYFGGLKAYHCCIFTVGIIPEITGDKTQ